MASPKRARSTAALTPAQEKFCQACAMGETGAGAYRAAFPKARKWDNQAVAVEASKLKASPKIRQRIKHLIAVKTKLATDRYAISADKILSRLANIAFADIADVVQWGDAIPLIDPDSGETRICNGVALIGADMITAEARASIAEISEGPNGIRVKLRDSRQALVDLGKHVGLFKDKSIVEHVGKDGKPIEVEAKGGNDIDIARRVAFLLAGRRQAAVADPDGD